MAYKQFQSQGAISFSMLLLNAFQGFYVWDALASERAILTTMDVTTDGFGFMLAFGDLAWVPFIYSLQVSLSPMNQKNFFSLLTAESLSCGLRSSSVDFEPHSSFLCPAARILHLSFC
jgi:hypothetical protein